MIPQIIHYCWFGNKEYPELVKKCIESWKKFLPHYKFMLWNEDSFDVNMSAFTREAYKNKKYAFVSDYVRIFALQKFGGIYLDTDVEIIKNIDELLIHRGIFGFDDGNYIISSFIGMEPDNEIMKELLQYYNSIGFVLEDGKLNETPNTVWIQKLLTEKFNLKANGTSQVLSSDIKVLPEDYLHAKSLYSGKINITSNTYAIHHHTLLWVSKKTILVKFLRQKVVIPLIGKNRYIKLVKFLRRE